MAAPTGSSKPGYVMAPPGWTHEDPNPFSEDGSYGPQWSAFCVLDTAGPGFTTGKSGAGPFSARFGQNVPNLVNRLGDFIFYENLQGRTPIISFPPGFDGQAWIARALAAAAHPSRVRPSDPAVIVHATTPAAWKSIQADGELKAASQLDDRIISGRSTGQGRLAEYLLHEPPEYRDYIMFGELDSYFPELVVACSQAGKFILDENAPYPAGVRIFLDHHRIIRAGLGVRDGLHLIKVHLRLPIHPYILYAVSTADIHPPGAPWTVKTFVDQANTAFHRINGRPG
jgi:hypothetical protein